MKLQDHQDITRKEIQEALEQYLATGGKITNLPPQITLSKFVIMGNRGMDYGIYEDLDWYENVFTIGETMLLRKQ